MIFKQIMRHRQSFSYLHIAEKNSIAKQVAAILSEGTKRTGSTLSKYNPVFIFERDGSEHTFSSVRGHLFDYQLPQECKNWTFYDNSKILTREVPMIKIPGEDMESLLKNLQNLARGKQNLVLWLDCDREGEAIAFEVLDVIKNINPNISVSRARFAAVTRADIIRAWENLAQPNILEADAVNYRIEMDFRMGCAFTRYQTVTLSKKVKFKDHQIVSYGPCQMPTLGFVVQRYLQIKNFKPEKYWVIEAAIILSQKSQVELKWLRGNTRNEQEANLLFYAMFENAHQGEGKVVGKILERNKNEKKKYRPYPLTTVTFQKLATDKLKISSAEAMKIAEKLYQKGFISYPRTETNSFPSTMNLNNLVQRLNNCPDYESYIQSLLQGGKFMKPKVGGQSDQAHTPIHPVKSADPSTLQRNQWRVFDLISRHFLACCSRDAVGIQSEIIAQIGKEKFKASHLHIKQKNYLQIYPFDKWAESDFPGQIPDQFQASVALTQNQTKPPGYLTQSQLIGMMERNQIGTDATIHEHIETIQNRKYAFKQGSTFRPSNLGASLIVTYKALELHLEDCHIRRLIEERMDKIAEGQIERNNAALQTLAEVGPLFAKLRALEETWLDRMRQAMEEHRDLIQIQTQNQENSMRSRRNDSDEDVSNVSNNNTNFQVKCFSCGEPGHTSPNCPHKGRKSPNGMQSKSPNRMQSKRQKKQEENKTIGFKGIVCYNCKEPGHLTTQCPSKQGINKQTGQNAQTNRKYTCFICGQQGHFAPDCPEKKQGVSSIQGNKKPVQSTGTMQKEKVKCYACGQFGHFSSNCPKKGGFDKQQERNTKIQKPKKTCQACGVQGRHPRGSNCPMVKRKPQSDPQHQDF